MTYDVIIIGGSYAGLAAAMPLARARRNVLVVDAGQRRNRFADHSHGFLTQDGTEAAEIARIGREQLLNYETVSWIDGAATDAVRTRDGFRVQVEGMEAVEGRRLVLATGVTDHLPDIPGLAQRWGRSVFHCPYCHGYELEQQPVAVLASSPRWLHHAMMLPDWGPTTVFLNGFDEPGDEDLAKLARCGVMFELGPVAAIEGKADVRMKDGRVLSFAGIFTMSRIDVAGPIASALGCEIEESVMGRTIRTDALKATSVPGVFACGDVARPGGSLPLAVGDGTLTGTAVHQSLLFS